MLAYVIIFAFIGVGLGLSRVPGLPAQRIAKRLNDLAIYICLPALILLHVPTLSADASLAPLVITPWLILVVTVLVVLPLCRWLGWSREVTAVLLVLLPLGNTSFLGFPLVTALFGEQYLSMAVVYDQFGSFLMVCTYVLIVIGWFSASETPSVRCMTERMVKFPPFLALCAALLFGHDWLGRVGFFVFEALADALLPIVTVAIGLSLKWQMGHGLRKPLIFGVVAKLLGIPSLVTIVFWAASHWLSFDPAVIQVVLLEAAMPAMITAAALLSRARLAPDLANGMVAWSVMLSVLTVPVWYRVGTLIWGDL